MSLPLPDYYSAEAREASFVPPKATLTKSSRTKASKKQQPHPAWPHPPTYRATPETLAAAGFFYSDSNKHLDADNIDQVECFLCGHSLSGWEPDDDPHFEHSKRIKQIKCAWAVAICSVQADRLAPDSSQWRFLSSDRLPTAKALEKARHGTFGGHWPFDNSVPKAQAITSKKLAEAGFVWTPSDDAPDTVSCPYCNTAFDSWGPSDDPIALHQKKKPNCAMFTARIAGDEDEDGGADSMALFPARKMSTKTPKNRKASSAIGSGLGNSTSGAKRKTSAPVSASLKGKRSARHPEATAIDEDLEAVAEAGMDASELDPVPEPEPPRSKNKRSARKTTTKKSLAATQRPEPDPEPESELPTESEVEPEATKPKTSSRKKTPSQAALMRSTSKSQKPRIYETPTEDEPDAEDGPPRRQSRSQAQAHILSRNASQTRPSTRDPSTSGGHTRSRSQSHLRVQDAGTSYGLRRSVSANALHRSTRMSAVMDVDEEEAEEQIAPAPRAAAATKVIRKKKERVARPHTPDEEPPAVEAEEEALQPKVEPEPVPPPEPKPKTKAKKARPIRAPSPNGDAVSDFENSLPTTRSRTESEVPTRAKAKGQLASSRTPTVAGGGDVESVPAPRQAKVDQGKAKLKAEPLSDRNIQPQSEMESQDWPAAPHSLGPDEESQMPEKSKAKTMSKSKAPTRQKLKPHQAPVVANPWRTTAASLSTEPEVTTESDASTDLQTGEQSEVESMTSDSGGEATPHSHDLAPGDEEEDTFNLPSLRKVHIDGSVGPVLPKVNGTLPMEDVTRTPPAKPSTVAPTASLSTPRNRSAQALPSPAEGSHGASTSIPLLGSINSQTLFTFTAAERAMTLKEFVQLKMDGERARLQADGEREIAEFLQRAKEVRRKVEEM